MSTKTIRVALIAVAAWTHCGDARAQDIRIDLSTFLSSTAGNWNNISNLIGLTPNLKDFVTGAATAVSINGGGSPWQNFYGDESGSFPNSDWLIQPATVDGAGLSSNQTGSFSLAGLNAPAYRVEVVSARNSFNYQNTVTVNGLLASRTYLGTPVNTPWGSTSDGLTPGNWLIWENAVPTSGNLVITDVSGPGTLGIINAMRIFAVPEPSTIIFAVLCLLACDGRYRRR